MTSRRVLSLLLASVVSLPAAALAGEGFHAGELTTATSNIRKREPAFAQLRLRGDVDIKAFRQAIDLHRRNDFSAADQIALEMPDGGAKAALAWSAIRLHGSRAGLARIENFLEAYPGFPMSAWIRRRGEEALLSEKAPAARIKAYFKSYEPEMAAGKIALAQAASADGEVLRARQLVHSAWRGNNVPESLAKHILAAFPNVIGKADQKYRAEKLIYKERTAAGLASAAKAGPEEMLLARALAAAVDESSATGPALAAVPKSLHLEPAYLFAKALFHRRKNELDLAAQAMSAAPRAGETLVDGDAWWAERRLLARKLLDAGKPFAAYETARFDGAESNPLQVESAFMAGWIALRYLNDPINAKAHFQTAAALARTPISIARAEYWLGRSLEESGQDAMPAYLKAARHTTAYYGQLARRRAGLNDLPLQHPAATEDETAAFEALAATRAIKLLVDAGERALALPLIYDMGDRLENPGYLDALGAILASQNQARLLLVLGKAALQRNVQIAHHAFPDFGVPEFTPVEGSASRAMVFSIARQESEFEPKALSHAGARGLMQFMPATARRTASKFKLPFHLSMLTDDPAFAARLGGAHLGELMQEYRGSLILTFAAYNAGGGRVKQWIAAYGDPRNPDVDPIDWIERIPITETRNYVQRIVENLQVYRARLEGSRVLAIDEDMRRGRPFASVDLLATP